MYLPRPERVAVSLPGWVEPGPKDEQGSAGGEAVPDDAVPEGADAPADAVDAAVGELAVKPVLEWTNQDWARWIDSADAGPPEATEAVQETVESADVGASETVAGPEPEPEANDEWAPKPAVPPGSEPEDEWAPEAVATEPVLENEWAPGSEPEDEWAPEASDDTAAAADDWVPELEAVATAPAEHVVPAGRWDTAGPAPSDEPSPSDQTDEDPDRDDVPAAAAMAVAPATDAQVDDDEWSGVADHPWWESAPVRDEPDLLDPDPVTRVEAPSSGRFPRAEPSEVPAPAVAAARPSTSTTRAMPAAPTGRGDNVVRRQPVAPESSHRVRSAFGLLGVAVTVGMVMAGLITVAIFAISLALRQAVG